MSDIFKTKVRPVGTSLGVLIPLEIAKKMNVREGEIVEISILKERQELVKSSFGIAKGTKKFVREHVNREI